MIDATISHYRIVGKPLRTPFGVTSGDGLSCGRETRNWAGRGQVDEKRLSRTAGAAT